MNYTMTHNVTNGKGQYDEKAYNFYYDWRLDPMELADELHKYIEAVKKAKEHEVEYDTEVDKYLSVLK